MNIKLGLQLSSRIQKELDVLSYDQSEMLRHYENNGFKTFVSNDYDYIIEQLIEYFKDVRITCSYCPRKFISSWSIKNPIKSLHKIALIA